ncbi:hypothetical protein EIN_131100 [Entamoeba invadens IP1]|uniref:PQ loop repeat protein n=1 Tax=Entamoeba invadens IP1 TaxID=370355 RepID=A0A0A1UD18_ENTIV|nr:hypothetical protein EIN_131100 [Entamoeba invadens IP1]ELP94321.1 hypothetical protein EIN_131100 [Entamoeba invadens IP1]|eukprot:XP_004261092.1 hypothetical protein EIN_131100 [Entamoeba invadens IP1]
MGRYCAPSLTIIIVTFLLTTARSSGMDVCTDSSESSEYFYVPGMSVFEIVLGVGILIFTVISMLPQLVKIIRRQDGEGLSPTYLLFLCCNQVFAFVNSTIFNWSIMKSCSAVGINRCFPPLLSYFQMLALVSLEYPIFASFLIFYKDKKKPTFWRALAFFGLAVVFLMVCLMMILVSEYLIGMCADFTYWFGYVFGFGSAVITFFEYIPQIWRTFRTKRCGSMSLTANSIQTFGCIVITFYMFFSTKQHYTTLVSYIMSTIQHIILVSLQIKYDYIDRYVFTKYKCWKCCLNNTWADSKTRNEALPLKQNEEQTKEIEIPMTNVPVFDDKGEQIEMDNNDSKQINIKSDTEDSDETFKGNGAVLPE